MGRTAKEETPKKMCMGDCEKEKKLDDFFLSNNEYHKKDSRFPICKDCVKLSVNINDMQSIYKFLSQINRPFIDEVWQSSLIEAEKTGRYLLGTYIKNVQLNKKYNNLEYTSSIFASQSNENNNEDSKEKNDKTNLSRVNETSQDDDKNRLDVIKLVGYDPFELENPNDKNRMYNKLIDFLDESTLEDGFKLPAVIEIVKAFNQIDKINSALSVITSDSKTVASNVGGIKSLMEAKEKMLRSVLALAKDNGISVNHNNNKSKGSGTLSGIIKQLQEKGFQEAEVNVFDIETAAGLSQVANISNRSIISQLQFDENDYTEMLMEQREIITELRDKNEKLEEENRILKIKLKAVAENEE